MERKIKLSEEILERLQTLGYIFDEKVKNFNVVRYYLTTNIEKLLGKDEYIVDSEHPDLDECETAMTKDAFIFKSIFADKKYSISLEDSAIVCVNLTDNELVFKIAPYASALNNHLIIDTDEDIKYYNYSADLTSQTYLYTSGDIIAETETRGFEGSLKAIGARHNRNQELFEFAQIYPLIKREDSLLKRIVDSIKTNNFVSIYSSEDLVDDGDNIAEIFASLYQKENAHKLILASKND